MPTATRYRKPKDFSTLWREQRSGAPLPTSQPRYKARGTYTTGNPYPPGSADYYAWQAFVGPTGGFASDDIWQEQHAGYTADDQKTREHANKIANLDQAVRGWFQQLAVPSSTDASLDNLDRTIKRAKAGY